MTLASSSTPPRLFTFVGGNVGPWEVVSAHALVGEALPPARSLHVVAGKAASPISAASWELAGITSNERYVERHEKTALVGSQAGIGRPEATCAALIPIRKSAAWWALPQEERRAVFEAQSHHIAIGLR